MIGREDDAAVEGDILGTDNFEAVPKIEVESKELPGQPVKEAHSLDDVEHFGRIIS